MLISVDDVHQPEGQIVTGYEGFEAMAELKINGYFRLNDDGVVINARPLMEQRERATAIINSIARRLRQRAENEVPSEPGNCIESGFLPDEPANDDGHPGELISIGFRFKEFPDTHLSIQIMPSNPHDPEGSSLQRQWKRIKEDPATPEELKSLANTKFFRESSRRIRDWKTGYEVLIRSPDEEGSLSHHDFEVKFTGVPHDAFQPYIDVQLQTGIAGNAAGGTKAILSDDEAIALWDIITSTLRVRPTHAAGVKSAEADGKPRLPLGEIAATGRACPQTGWWEPEEPAGSAVEGRRYIKYGERMPHVVAAGKPSLWQKLKGEQVFQRTGTVWQLVSYDGTVADAAPPQLSSVDSATKDGAG
nr:T6SS immunity protein Tli4 family protein [uncultured Massilia sp.]